MLKRKIEKRLTEWKNTPGHKPLIIKGCRQCGKTFSVLEFAKKNYKHVVYLNFFENPDYASVFAGSLDIDNIVMLLSALLGKEAVFETGETVLVLDEIQDCPEARTALKFFRIDGRYDVIGTGSLLGVKGYGKEPKSVPVGSETVIDMYPLDFEEFLWANGISEPVIDMLQKALDTETPVPNGDTIGRFRNLLVKNGLQEKLFAQVVTALTEQGLILKKGTIVDSTIISAPSSTKNKEKKRDPDAHQVKKGNTWHFGYKAHVGVDKDSGLVHTVEATPANVHDVTQTSSLLTGEEDVVYGDSGYLGAGNREDAIVRNKSGRKIKYKINRRPSQLKKLSKSGQYAAKKAEHAKSSVRAKVEHVFGVVKKQLQFRKTRYRGLEKQRAKFNIMFALANLLLADRPCLAA